MWTSERSRRPLNQEAEAETGLVTMGGDPAGVLLGGERRWLPVYSPGGYSWRPAAGDQVLVLKTGGEREAPCILGTVQDASDLGYGEVRLTSGDSRIHLKAEELELSGGDSRITLGKNLTITGGNSKLQLGNQLALSGAITVNGQSLEGYIRGIVYSVLNDLFGG